VPSSRGSDLRVPLTLTLSQRERGSCVWWRGPRAARNRSGQRAGGALAPEVVARTARRGPSLTLWTMTGLETVSMAFGGATAGEHASLVETTNVVKQRVVPRASAPVELLASVSPVPGSSSPAYFLLLPIT
jgi:hypothetical protein